MRVRWRTAAGIALIAALLPACAPEPRKTEGTAAPLTATATATASRTPSAPSRSPSAGLPPVPTAYEQYRLTASGITVALPVPADWARKATPRGSDFDLQSPDVLLRVEVTPRKGATAREGWAAYEPGVRSRLSGYRLLGIQDVSTVGDSALDWFFTFIRDGDRRVVNRLIVSGGADIAVYYTAPAGLYDRYLPVWTTAVQGLQIS
jgi:hypothetical protein